MPVYEAWIIVRNAASLLLAGGIGIVRIWKSWNLSSASVGHGDCRKMCSMGTIICWACTLLFKHRYKSYECLLRIELDKRKLPPWRHHLRQRLLPLVRWETPYLAWMQVKMRTPALDSYFAITANLGTHTFFMVFLPILFWCGYTSLGRG